MLNVNSAIPLTETGIYHDGHSSS